MHDFEMLLAQMTTEKFKKGYEKWFDKEPEMAYKSVWHAIYGYNLCKSEYEEAIALLIEKYKKPEAWSVMAAIDILKSMNIGVDEKYKVIGENFNAYDVSFLAMHLFYELGISEAKQAVMYAVHCLKHNPEKAYHKYCKMDEDCYE